jgi:hypothetical protein
LVTLGVDCSRDQWLRTRQRARPKEADAVRWRAIHAGPMVASRARGVGPRYRGDGLRAPGTVALSAHRMTTPRRLTQVPSAPLPNFLAQSCRPGSDA